MDPCGGSGHFVVAAFEMLRRMRMEEEGLTAAAAGDAVIRDNLFMLELDPRCTQIADLRPGARRLEERRLPPPADPQHRLLRHRGDGAARRLAAAGGRTTRRLRTALERLYKLFRDAPTLGSLINPADVPLNERMFSADYEEVAPLLEKALAKGTGRSGRGRAGRGGGGGGEGGEAAGGAVHAGGDECAVSAKREAERGTLRLLRPLVIERPRPILLPLLSSDADR